ncbi:MAG: nicotinate (nicotinamide) nucleotide adenylyltransferase [Burkholderiales bacterium]
MATNCGPVGILGGTFDPVHNAHLAIARRALEALGATRILWMPTGAPGYRNPPQAPAAQRVAMLGLAIEGEARYALDERELAPGASGYTYDTLTALRNELGAHVPLVMLIGSDQYEKLDAWHRARDLFQLCRLAVFARPGWSASATGVPRDGITHVPMEPLAISASDIRARIGRGEDVSPLLPAPVLHYIRRHHLYGHP